MDISSSSWVPEKEYEKHEIVRMENLAIPPAGLQQTDENGDLVQPIANDEKQKISTDQEYVISAEILKEGDLSKSQEIVIGTYFDINQKLSYSVSCMVKKDGEDALTIDEYKTYITRQGQGGADINKSIGVGIGIKYQDSSGKTLQPKDLRSNHRLMAGSELSHKEYYNVAIDIDSSSIPEGAVGANLFIFVYGHKSGSFVFKKPFVSNLGRFFYCLKDHSSSVYNSPNSEEGLDYWTQDFVWRPSYGSKADFVAANDSIELGEGKDYVTNLAINSLPMQLDIKFNNRTDKEAKAIIHFLQEKFFAYESIFSLDYKGDRLTSSDVASFNFVYSYPYRQDLKYTCVDFSHSIVYRNNNTISAKFICNTESTLASVDSHHGYNKRLDALVPIFIDKTTHFQKGVPIKLNTFTLEQGDGATELDNTNIIKISRYPEDPSKKMEGGVIHFESKEDLVEGQCIFVTVKDPENSIYNVRKTKVIKKISDTKFAFSPVLKEGSEENVVNLRATSSAGEKTSVRWFDEVEGNELEPRSEYLETADLADQLWKPDDKDKITPRPELAEYERGAQYFEEDGSESITTRQQDFEFFDNISITKMSVCPENCLYSKVLMPEGVDVIKSELIDPATGENRKRQVYLKNYRRLQVDTDIKEDTTTIQFTPLENFTLESKDDFWLLIPAVRGRSSIYIKDPDEIIKYPWLQVRNFDHKPSLAFSVQNTPKHIQSEFVEYYNKKYKKQINQNLSTFNVIFDKRSDEEAAEILQFLESHLGCKKFRFNMPRPYVKDESHITSPSRPFISTFYCPSWGHDIVYKNNHTISATFIESTTSIEEDLRSVFGIGRDEERPCYGAEIHNPITTHKLCTASSVLQAAKGVGFDVAGDSDSVTAKSKAVDLVFIVDTTGSMTNQYVDVAGDRISKYKLTIDVILKMVTAYDNYLMPGTQSFGGIFNAPQLSFGSASGDDTVPPWPADNEVLNSLIGKLYTPLKELRDSLSDEGYNLKNLDRFKIKIDEKRVNIGFVLMADPREIIQDVSEYPGSFDKIQTYQKVNVKDPGWRNLEDSPRAVSQALAQFYNSPRAEHVTDRIVIMLSDGVFTSADATLPKKANGAHDYDKFHSQYTLDMCAQLRKGGELAKRRPSNEALKKYGYLDQNPLSKLEAYKNKQSDGGLSQYNNPDNGKDNPAWYEEELPTVFMFATVGIPGQLSIYAPNYVYDYDQPAPYLNPPSKTPQFFFPITKSNEPSGEVERMMDLIKVVEMLTNDTGYQNIFSIVLYNCGPHDVKLLNTLVSTDSQLSPLKWTTEILKEGIVKGGNTRDISFSEPNQDITSIAKGYGGQYYGDALNQNLFSEESTDSNILWESFNTKYEVYRAGQLSQIDGGWASHQSETNGVRNTGVAFKGMPIRVFKSDSGLEIIDYNIGNTNSSNDYKGDYSHLPVLKPGESLDLFFGIKTNKLSDFSETVQFLINSNDGTLRRMDSYANYKFDITIPSSKATKPSEPVAEEPEEVVGYGVHIANLPIGGSHKDKTYEDFKNEWGAMGVIGDLKLLRQENNKTRSMVAAFNEKEDEKNTFDPNRIKDSSIFLNETSIPNTKEIKKKLTGLNGSDQGFGAAFFDRIRGIAAKEGSTVKIYSKENFKGSVLFEKTGPFLLYDSSQADPIMDDYLNSFGINSNNLITEDTAGWLEGSIEIIQS